MVVLGIYLCYNCPKVKEKDTFGTIKNQAKIRWLTYVSDDIFKKMLVRYFENKK